jgi:hypothetical protein
MFNQKRKKPGTPSTGNGDEIGQDTIDKPDVDDVLKQAEDALKPAQKQERGGCGCWG